MSPRIAVPQNRSRLVLTVRILHIAWAIPCAVVSVVLATSTGGHPPGLVFLPLAVLVWAAGHASIWGAARLARHGAARRGSVGWPPLSIGASILLAGLAACAGLYLVVAVVITGRGPSGSTESAVLVTVWFGHLAAFVGLLLRSAWGRFAAAACSTGWLIALAVQIVDHLAYGRPVDAAEAAVVMIIAVGLSTLGYRLLFGRSEKEYAAPRSHAEPSKDA